VIENCARPGCGHPASHHVVIGGCNIDTERGLCPCSAYRTQAQQEAWERANGALDYWELGAGGNAVVDGDELCQAVERLLELYP
jgi:hypothetical protein